MSGWGLGDLCLELSSAISVLGELQPCFSSQSEDCLLWWGVEGAFITAKWGGKQVIFFQVSQCLLTYKYIKSEHEHDLIN